MVEPERWSNPWPVEPRRSPIISRHWRLDLEKKKADMKVKLDYTNGGRVYMMHPCGWRDFIATSETDNDCFLESTKVLMQIKKNLQT